MKHVLALCIAISIALSPAAASGAPDGIYVSVFTGGFEYLSLASTGGPDVTGFIQSFTYALNAQGGLTRSRRDVAGTAQAGRITLHDLPTWAGGEALTGNLGWDTVTLRFAKPDGTIGDAIFKKTSAADVNAMIAHAVALAANAVRVNRANIDLQNSSVALRNAQAELPLARQAILALTQQLASASASATHSQDGEAAARAHEADERAIEQRMRDQEAAMPDTTPDEHRAKNDYHQLVNEQHGKVNDAHGLVNDAHGSANDSGSSARMLKRNLTNEQQHVVQLQHIIASATARIQSDNQIHANPQRQ